MTVKVLNLYAGIGGNRKLWDDVTDNDVTAVEWDESAAEIYQENFPNDDVVVADAHEFLLNHYDDGWDFIWSSPPCPTHSRTQVMNVLSDDESAGNHKHEEQYPDMDLYQEVIFLENFADCDWAVENTISYYEPLIQPQVLQRHYIWSNFNIPHIDLESDNIQMGTVSTWEEHFGFDVSGYDGEKETRKLLRNAVHPQLGKHILESATVDRQATLDV